MADVERPSRVVSLRRVARAVTPPSPGELARRLAALERQVEQALADETPAQPPAAVDLLRGVVDDALSVVASARRWLAGEPVDGLHPLAQLSRQALYRLWWRVDVVGRERLPATGRVLVVVNRAGTFLPYEPFMVAAGLGTDARPARPFVDEALLGLPLLGQVLASFDARAERLAGVRRALDRDELAIVQPEGAEGVAHPWPQRYRVAGFGRGGVLRAAIETGAPVVPVSAIGSEEVHPTLARLELPGRLLGLPALPLAPNLVPLPTKWTLYVGEPLDVRGRFDPAASKDVGMLRALRVQVRERLQALVTDGLRRRRGLFA